MTACWSGNCSDHFSADWGMTQLVNRLNWFCCRKYFFARLSIYCQCWCESSRLLIAPGVGILPGDFVGRESGSFTQLQIVPQCVKLPSKRLNGRESVGQ